MNHPKPEEWAPFVYDEASGETHRQLREHLRACPECRRQIETWRRAAGKLKAWKLPRHSLAPGGWLQPYMKWAVAGGCAALFLLAGLALGRTTMAPAKLEAELKEQLRGEFAAMLRDELSRNASSTLAASAEQTRGLLVKFAEGSEVNRAEDREAVYAALDRLYLSLKKDLDTVAVFTDSGLRDTRLRLVQMASSTEPAAETGPQTNHN